MLKWAVTPRLNGDCFEQNSLSNGHGYQLLTLEAVLTQNRLPCLVRLSTDDIQDSIDNYCLLLCENSESYLMVSNESDRFSIPTSFDGKLLLSEDSVLESRARVFAYVEILNLSI